MIDKILKTDGGIDMFDDMAFTHMQVTLLVSVGRFNAGEKFEYAAIDYDKGMLALQRDGDEWVFDLALTIR
jgi:hypothetical protein